ncbi:recombinase family protein [Streptomyces nigrescens]
MRNTHTHTSLRPPQPDGPDALTRYSCRWAQAGYARCSTAQQELPSQLDALQEAGCDRSWSG